tara:strand:+ start:355 stop:804 length:450 start_codon:yes stop_codon:yes gene_type:complete
MSDERKATTALTQLRSEPLELRVAEIGGHNANLRVLVLDEPMAPNGACHLYQIEIGDVPACTVNFQRGPVKQAGINGVSNEALLTIVAHRLEGFQTGEFGDRAKNEGKGGDNEEALQAVYAALTAMARRTQGRVLAQVEGYDKPDPGSG